ncbi:malto-oligosyltrehalose trehalohydrolase [Fulvimarina endophytica]|uniref:Malto-oligosyltrehalose trehalohydrolase n=1 Tax=Fulvimarina endophytica TaxID=2293836 RepID=A0A371XA41_9HYPH|nr:malto-oligosyltrehalose trehalohydrolase [Fulvimarina endophytica]RFC66086.1 malto-oligosyltrehalose trehalohydrolase [Fulvimarina endophytica]
MTSEPNAFAFDTSWGPRLISNGAEFRLWAPSAPSIELAVGDEDAKPAEFLQMTKDEAGWWRIETDRVKVGGTYGFRLKDGLIVPDPASRRQAGDVHSLSVLTDPKAYRWTTPNWNGRPWEETVFYELHTGTFTPDGTFEGIEEKLDFLVATGLTAIEIMPVAQFMGDRGWGYDGVLLYCPHRAYGGDEGLKRLIDAAHSRGLSVFLDVVYNHFGPDGNYLGAFAPEFFHEDIHTPWGPAIAYDETPVRQFMIENALYWLEEFRFDGLRLDAIDSIQDTTDTPLVKELASAVRKTFPGRHVHLTTEDDRNITWHVERGETDQPLLVSGEWNDDFHHTIHVLATQEEEAYYGDYNRSSVSQLAKSLATGFVYQGEHSPVRDKKVGSPSDHLPPTAFVNFIQNHDQIGNRAFGERLTDLASRRVLECAQAILCLSPQIPLLYMGEEWGETHPFCFFTDFHGELGDAVREGRRSEFSKFKAFRSERLRELIPDPNAEATFRVSTLDWAVLERPNREMRHSQVTELLKKRQEIVVPLLKHVPKNCGAYQVAENGHAFVVAWTLQDGKVLHLFANLGDDPWSLPGNLNAEDLAAGELVHSYQGDADESLLKGTLPGSSVVFRMGDRMLVKGDL